MEEVRLLVQEEGRAARNLIAFHVPVDQSQSETTNSGKLLVRKPPTSPRPTCDIKKEDVLRVSKRSCDPSKPGSRVRSASTGRDKKSELQARYWAFLFGNLQRAVDEIYQTCETDESVSECKEVILVLENYTRDFHSLIEWFKLKWEYENTPPPQRPTSLAWEVRKSSPGKVRNVAVPTSDCAVKESDTAESPSSIDVVATNCDIKETCNSEDVEKDVLPESKSLVEVVEVKAEETPKVQNQSDNAKIENNILDSSINSCVVSVKVVPEELVTPNVVQDKENISFEISGNEGKVSENTVDVMKEDIKCNEVANEIHNEDSSFEPTSEIAVSHKASQTDLEECIEDSNGIRFLSVGQPPPPPPPPTVPVPTSTPVAAPINKPATPVMVGKAPATTRAPLAAVRPGLRTSSVGPVSRPQTLSRPPYSTVSRYSSPYRHQPDFPTSRSQVVSGSSPKIPTSTNYSNTAAKVQSAGSSLHKQVSSLGRTSTNVVSSKQQLNPRLVRSRTSTDVRSTGRGVPLRRPLTDPPGKLQRSSTGARQNRIGPPSAIRGLPVLAKQNSVAECSSGPNLEQRSGSNSSLNSTASSGARSWADKVKGTEAHQRTTVSVEVLSRTGGDQDDDDTQGWETVKGRSRSRISPANKVDGLGSKLSCSSGNIKSKLERKGSARSHVQTRFHQPSAATSLPSLALREVPVRPPPPRKTPPRSYSSAKNGLSSKKTVKLTKKSSLPDCKNEFEKEEDKENSSKSISSTEIVTKDAEEKNNAKKLVDESFIEDSENDGDRLVGKDDEEDDELLLDSKLADILEERNLSEDELRKSKELSAEEEMLRKEIQELETTEIEVDTETDETETDGEATIGPDDDDEGGRKEIMEDSLTLEARYENILEGMSWAERMDTLEQLKELVARHPGRALELHQKLSSPSRRRTLPETLRRFQAKQAQAKEKRDQLRLERSQRLRELLNKVEEVKAAQAQLIEDKRVRLEMKLKRAEVNRRLHLKGIIRKAHDEEEKLKEIAFINELEAQNKRHDFMALCQEQEERLQGIQEERQRKVEEKAAKEAAAEGRRRVLEAERQERLEKMQELRRKREERILEREKERQELARGKARDREERILAVIAAQLATQEELQKKIQQKQEESARRHEENIEHIRQRALESSIMRCSTDDVAPRLAPYDTQKLCQACNVLIGSEVYLLSHLRGKKHQEAVQQLHGTNLSKEEVTSYNIRHIVDAPADKIDPKIALDKERQKALKKRCKKIRMRMASRGQEYEAKRETVQKVDSPNKGRLQKSLKTLEKLHASQGKGQWANNAVTGLERALSEINRILSQKDPNKIGKNALDQTAFQALNGFTILSNILSLAMDVPPNMAPYLPPKCFVTCCTTYGSACEGHVENCQYVLYSNKVSTILDLLQHRLSILIPDRSRMLACSSSGGGSNLPVDAVAGALMSLLALIMTHAGNPEEPSKEKGGAKEELFVRLQDVISYTVSVGVVDKLALYCGGVRDPIDNDPSAAQFLLSGLGLLTALAARCSNGRRGGDDGTQLVATLQVTELVGAVSMLYGMLLHQGAPPRGTATPPPALSPHTIAVTAATIRLLNRVAELDLHMFQSVLGAEGISLQFRHISSYLLWYCSYDKEKELLHEVVRVVGFFAVRNSDNQMMLQSGFMPTVLQQLCSLPFAYFSNPTLSAVLFPTLLACCSGNQQNRAILEQEVSYQLLEDFRNSEGAKNNCLVLMLSGTDGA